MESACTDTYRDVDKLLQRESWKICHRFHHVNFDEAMSAANEAYMTAYNSYDATKGASFPTWVFWQVRGALQAFAEREKRYTMRQKTGFTFTDGDDDSPRAPEPLQKYVDREVGLSQDAREILHLILETPEDLMEVLADLGDDREVILAVFAEFPKDIATMLCGWDRNKLRRGLKAIADRWGWSLAKTALSFRELEETIA